MQNDVQNDPQYDDEIVLRELFDVLWAGKIKIIAITVVFAVASVVYALSLPNQYKATALLAPAQSSVGGISGAGQMGGLAALAGVSIGGANTSEAEIALQIMKSWSFIEGFIADNDLAPEIFSAKGWNKESNELQINDGVYNTENKQWLIKNEAGVMGPPTSWDLFKTFSGQLAVTKEKKGMVSVSIEYYSPLIAKQWLDMYVAAINEHMRQRQVAKVTNNINYLQAQIEKTSVVEMREVFYAIIEEQTKNKMLAEASPEYAFVVVRQSMVPEEKSQPRRSSICILGTMLGGILSCLLVLMMHNFRKFD